MPSTWVNWSEIWSKGLLDFNKHALSAPEVPSDLYDFTTLRRDIMKERALEVQQERERHAKDVEVDDDEEQKKAKAATEDDEIRRQLLQQLTDREQQQKSFGMEIEEKVRVVWDGENVQVETVKTPIASDAVR